MTDTDINKNKIDKNLFQFMKDYKFFKKEQYLEVPNKRFTGQWRIENIWNEIEVLLKKGIIKKIK